MATLTLTSSLKNRTKPRKLFSGRSFVNPADLRELEKNASVGNYADNLTQEGGGFYRAESSSVEPGNEGAGFGYVPEGNTPNSGGGFKGFFWGSKARKRSTITGTIVSLVIGLLFGSFSLFSVGGGQLIQLSQILQRNFFTTRFAMSNRLNKEFSYASEGDIGTTRLGFLGKQYLRPILDKMQSSGIEVTTNSTGGMQSVQIKARELIDSNPDLSGYSESSLKPWIAKQLGVDPSVIGTKGVGADTLYTIDAASYGNPVEFPTAISRLIIGGISDTVSNGKILSAAADRVLIKYYDTPSIFSPFKYIASKVRSGTSTATESKASETEDIQTEVTVPEATVTNLPTIRDTLKGFFEGSVGKSIMNALIGVMVMCTVRNAANTIVAFDRAAIVLPAALEATRLIGEGNQVMYGGHNVTASQVGGTVNSLTNSSGQTVWQAKALQVTENAPNPSGPVLPANYLQAFAGTTTATNIINGATNFRIGSFNIGGFVCSKPGQLITIALSVAALIASAPSGGEGGVAVSKVLGYFAGKAAEAAAISGVLYFVKHELVTLLEDKVIVPAILSGPLGGNLLAYGAR